ncbi:MAG: hypothetical protein ABEH90_04860 [Halolamina sp.]
MSVVDCPECDFPFARSTGGDIVDWKAVYEFKCPECEHSWSVPIVEA